MLLAIDVGNTQVVFGLWDGDSWTHVWRRATHADTTEDEFAGWLSGLFTQRGLKWQVDAIVYASVVPALDAALHALGARHFGVPVTQISASIPLGITVDYDPPTAVGADRLANAIGALARYNPPIIVVDFGTATTFDAIDVQGHYAGGAILPGPVIAAQALNERTAKLPQVELAIPPSALGRNTRHALQSGLVLGYAAAIESLATQIAAELGSGTTIVATGGLGEIYAGLCPSIVAYLPTLTLDGLRLALDRVNGPTGPNHP
jgi:type III pantothenate kinase